MCGRAVRLVDATGTSGADDGTRGAAFGGCRMWAVGPSDAALPAETRVMKALTVLGPAAFGAGAIFTWLPSASWVVFAFGWMLFPVVGLLVGGLADLGREGLRRVVANDGWVWPLTMAIEDAGEASRRRALVALWRIRSAVARTPRGHDWAELDGLAETSDRLAAAVVRGELPPPLAADASDRLLPAAAAAVERFADYAYVLPAGEPTSFPAERGAAVAVPAAPAVR